MSTGFFNDKHSSLSLLDTFLHDPKNPQLDDNALYIGAIKRCSLITETRDLVTGLKFWARIGNFFFLQESLLCCPLLSP